MSDETDSLRSLIDVGRQLLAELEPDVVLERILEEARRVTGARYAALGILDEEDRSELARFLTVGIDEAAHSRIGDLPRGRGVLGVLIDDPQPLRLRDVGDHPQSFGFPPGHPPMRSFLGVPIVIRGRAWGNLYLTEKAEGAQFTDADEDSVTVLAQFAATAIENARLYQAAERGRQQLARAVRGLEAARNIADAISAEAELDRILELIVKRGRALIGARTVLTLLREGDYLVLAARAGRAADRPGGRVPVADSVCGRVLANARPKRIDDVQTDLPSAAEQFGVGDARAALIVPMIHRGVGLGVLIAYDRGAEREPFTSQDEELLRTFAASAANAVAISRSVEADRLRATIAAAEDERRRWARELHDQTLQSLGALRVMLSGAIRRDGEADVRVAVRQAIADLDSEIDNLRGIIADLRPPVLDDLGLAAALEALVARRRDAGLEIESHIVLPTGAETAPAVAPELETTIYRLVQESLTNVIKHANAGRARVKVVVDGVTATVEISDDGDGFDSAAPTSGFGLAGIRERVYLAGGEVSVSSDGAGTVVSARIPTGAAAEASAVTASSTASRK